MGGGIGGVIERGRFEGFRNLYECRERFGCRSQTDVQSGTWRPCRGVVRMRRGGAEIVADLIAPKSGREAAAFAYAPPSSHKHPHPIPFPILRGSQAEGLAGVA